MNFIRKISVFSLLVAAMAETNILGCAKGWHKNKYGICVKNGSLSKVSILNEYPEEVSIQLQWRNEHGTHNRFNTSEILKKNKHNTFKAPFLGYTLEKIIIIPTDIAVQLGIMHGGGLLAATALTGTAAAAGAIHLVAIGATLQVASTINLAHDIKHYNDSIKSHKNSYFVVTAGQGKKVYQGKKYPELIITAYKDQAAYKAAKTSKSQSQEKAEEEIDQLDE